MLMWTDFDFNHLDYINGEQCLAHLVLVRAKENQPVIFTLINRA